MNTHDELPLVEQLAAYKRSLKLVVIQRDAIKVELASMRDAMDAGQTKLKKPIYSEPVVKRSRRRMEFRCER